MKTKLLLAIFAILMTGTGFGLTADPNIVNGDFEDPVMTTNSIDGIYDWWHGQSGSGVNTRIWGPGEWGGGTQEGLNFGQLVNTNDSIFQPVALFQPNTPYEVSCIIQKRRDQLGPAGRIELWAGGTPLPPNDLSATGNEYGSANYPLTVAGATLVDSVSFDYSTVGKWVYLWGTKSFTLATGSSHTTSDLLYLVFVKAPGVSGGGQLGLDAVTMTISDQTFLMSPEDGAVDVPLATDLEWIGPGTYEGETFDVYLGTTEPNLALGAPYGLETTVATGISATSASPALGYSTNYYWLVDTYDGAVYHPATTYSAFTTIDEDVPPDVAFVQNGFRTWLQGPTVSVSATVTDLETIDSIDWAFTTVPANYSYGDPNLFLTDTTIDLTAPTAEINIDTTDPNATGYYVVTLSATDDAGGAGALTGSGTVWFTVHNDGCEAFIANGNNYRAYDANDDCVIDLTDAAAWFALWLEDRTATDPIIYLN